MRIIFIRHADPDYEHDSLTKKGWREAALLADRVSQWDVKDFYCSPLGRAQATASLSLDKMGRSAVTYEWMKEFSYMITDPSTGRHGVPWDFLPSYWTADPLFYDKEHWHETEVIRSNPDIITAYRDVCLNFDQLLKEYGYSRTGNFYSTPITEEELLLAENLKTSVKLDEGTAALKKPYCNDTIVIFCHLGISCVMISHLLGITPPLLWQNFFLAPSSVTVLTSEERMPGEAYFRVQVMGDTRHLHDGKEPVAQAGYFAEPFHM